MDFLSILYSFLFIWLIHFLLPLSKTLFFPSNFQFPLKSTLHRNFVLPQTPTYLTHIVLQTLPLNVVSSRQLLTSYIWERRYSTGSHSIPSFHILSSHCNNLIVTQMYVSLYPLPEGQTLIMFIIVNLNLMQLHNAKYFLNQSNLKWAFMPVYYEHTIMMYGSICLQVKKSWR